MAFSFNPFPALTTSRLLLRQLTAADSPCIFSLRSNHEVNTYINRPIAETEADAAYFIHFINEGIAADKWIYWAIAPAQEPAAVMGTICLWNLETEPPKGEIGYELLPAFQGNGFMQEAFSAIMYYAAATLQLKKIEAFTHGQNQPSLALLLKNGFVHDPAAEAGLDPEKEAGLTAYSRML